VHSTPQNKESRHQAVSLVASPLLSNVDDEAVCATYIQCRTTLPDDCVVDHHWDWRANEADGLFL